MPMTAKKVANSFSGRSLLMDRRDTYGNTKSITATKVAQIMSIQNSFFCREM